MSVGIWVSVGNWVRVRVEVTVRLRPSFACRTSFVGIVATTTSGLRALINLCVGDEELSTT